MKVDQSVLAVLSTATIEGNKVRLSGQLDRKLYVATNKILEAAGGKWDRKSKAHIFPEDAEGALDDVILTGEIEFDKPPHKVAEFFPTPEKLVRQMIELAELKSGMLVLEPEAGEGHIAHIVAETNMVDCIERENRYATKIHAKPANIGMVMVQDFMSITPAAQYDAVIMNPPFSKRQDIKHVLHAFNFLKDGGVLVAIMSAGVKFREDKLTKDFREFVSERGEIIDNPEGSFKSSGTMVNTVTVVIRGVV